MAVTKLDPKARVVWMFPVIAIIVIVWALAGLYVFASFFTGASSIEQGILITAAAGATAILFIPSIILVEIRYNTFTYELRPKEIVIDSGIITRNHVSIPYERIQNVNMKKKLPDRLLGLSEVTIETAAGTLTAEGILPAVSNAEALVSEIVGLTRVAKGQVQKPAEEDEAKAYTQERLLREILQELKDIKLALAGERFFRKKI